MTRHRILLGDLKGGLSEANVRQKGKRSKVGNIALALKFAQ